MLWCDFSKTVFVSEIVFEADGVCCVTIEAAQSRARSQGPEVLSDKLMFKTGLPRSGNFTVDDTAAYCMVHLHILHCKSGGTANAVGL
jgi:hypothetical protein